MTKAGRPIDPADLPPALEWERPIWDLYAKFSTQWRVGFSGRYGYDYGPAMQIAAERRWSLDSVTDLLRSIESVYLECDERKRELSGQV